MGSHIQTIRSQCTRFLPPLPSSLSSLPTRSQWPMPQPQLITNQPHMSQRSSPLSHSPTNTELLMTTARPTSRSPRQDANGVVSGSFVIVLPNGRIQTTTPTADHTNGFVADVTYEGTPVYPPEPKE